MVFFAAEWGLRAAGDGVNLPQVDIWGKKKQICTKPSDPSRLRPKAPAAVLRGNPKKIKIKPKGHDVAKPTQGRTPKNAPFPAQKCFFFSITPISRYFGVVSAQECPKSITPGTGTGWDRESIASGSLFLPLLKMLHGSIIFGEKPSKKSQVGCAEMSLKKPRGSRKDDAKITPK